MTANIMVTSPYQPFTLPNKFGAVFNGYVYRGLPDKDPLIPANQVPVFAVNEDGSRVQVEQPLRTNAGGFLVYNGKPAKFVTDDAGSLLVQDSLKSQIWYEPDVSSIDPSSMIAVLGGVYGSGMIGYCNYSDVREYSGSSTRLNVYGRSNVFDKAYGVFCVDPLDQSSQDNNGTVLIDRAGRRWKRQFSGAISMHWFGADPNGIEDSSPAFQFATIATGTSSIIIDAIYRIKTPVEVTKRLVFHDGGLIKIDAGIVFRANKRPDASPTQWIFDGSPTTNAQWKDAYVDWFGDQSYGFGISAQRASSVTGVIRLTAKSYVLGPSQFNVPQGKNLSIIGVGFRQSILTVSSGSVAINYKREQGSPASSLLVKNIEFSEAGSLKSSISILWWGYSSGSAGSETVISDDNWLRVNRCVFSGVGKGTHTKFAGQCHFDKNMSLYSSCMHFKERGSSFHYHSGEMCLSSSFVNGGYIYGDDQANDAYSNGLFLDSCNSVTCAGIDIRLRGWQAVFIDKGGFDLGSAGQAALWFGLCQDVQLDSVWVASTIPAAAANRYGVVFDNCRNSNVSNGTIVNNKRGISGLSSSSIGVHGVTFEGNLEYDIADSGAAVGWAISGTRHRTAVSSGAPIWLNSSGSGSHTVIGAIMKQASHTIPVGVNSQVIGNVFGAALS